MLFCVAITATYITMLSLSSFKDIIFVENFILTAVPLDSQNNLRKNVKFSLDRESIAFQKVQGNLGHFWTGFSLFFDQGTLENSIVKDEISHRHDLFSIGCVQTAKYGQKCGSLGLFTFPLDKKYPVILSEANQGDVSLAPVNPALTDVVEYIVTDTLNEPVTVLNTFNAKGCVLRVTLVQTRTDPVNRK